MRNYQKITQNPQDQLLAWYETEDHTGDRQTDFDVLQDYAVYPHETGAFIAEYTPTLYAFGSYATLEEALEAVKERIAKKIELTETTNQKIEEFQKIVGASSLDGRYANVVVEKKPKTNDQLREKYAVARMNTTARLNRDYYARLLDH